MRPLNVFSPLRLYHIFWDFTQEHFLLAHIKVIWKILYYEIEEKRLFSHIIMFHIFVFYLNDKFSYKIFLLIFFSLSLSYYFNISLVKFYYTLMLHVRHKISIINENKMLHTKVYNFLSSVIYFVRCNILLCHVAKATPTRK